MKPWEAFFDKDIFWKYHHIYLLEEKQMKEGVAKRYINNLYVQLRNLAKQRNTQPMRDALGLSLFEQGMEEYFAILAKSRDPKRGEGIKAMLKDYVAFLHKMEDLKCVSFEISSRWSKEYPIEDMQRYQSNIPKQTRTTRYTLTFKDGKSKEYRPLDALVEVAKLVDFTKVRQNEITWGNRPILLDKHFIELDELYKPVPGTNLWVYSKAGVKNKELVSLLLPCVPVEKRPVFNS